VEILAAASVLLVVGVTAFWVVLRKRP
jgi:hypothetical protein